MVIFPYSAVAPDLLSMGRSSMIESGKWVAAFFAGNREEIQEA